MIHVDELMIMCRRGAYTTRSAHDQRTRPGFDGQDARTGLQAARATSHGERAVPGGELTRPRFVLVSTDMKSSVDRAATKRTYRMRARAASAAETGERILRAVLDLHVERFHDQITLEDVAERAGVTVQTVLRRFGSKDALIAAAADHASTEVRSQRMAAPAGDIPAAVDNLLDHYETSGAAALRLLAQEDRVPQLREIADRGRDFHYEWVERTFAPFLDNTDGRQRLRAQLIALTDVYTWKLLHRDLGMDRTGTRDALIEMIQAVVDQGGSQ